MTDKTVINLGIIRNTLEGTNFYIDGTFTKMNVDKNGKRRKEILVKIHCRRCGKVMNFRMRDVIRKGVSHLC